jgi:protocatechuate 3,4-dioxygenase alpha subunit
VRPAAVPGGAGARQAAHVNVCLFARGLLRQLHTRIYFAGDPALDDDAVLSLVPADRRATLVARRDPSQEDRWVFDLRLQGNDETVFFDL